MLKKFFSFLALLVAVGIISANASAATTAGTTTSTVSSTGTSSSENFAYLDAAWFDGSNPVSDSSIANFTRNMADQQIHTQFCDIGLIQDDGTLPASGYVNLAHWIQQARLADPQVKIIPVLNYGKRRTNTNFGTQSFNNQLNTAIKTLKASNNIDGIHLDIEAFKDNDTVYLHLMSYLKANSLRSLPLYIATPATTWSNSFITQVAGVAQELNPMVYDTMGWGSSVVDGPTYTDYFQKVATTYSNAIGTLPCKLAPTLPSYLTRTASDGTVYHDQSVENITNGITALNNAIAAGAHVSGAGIFWWPNFNGLYPTIYTQYQQDQNAWTTNWLKI
ncbi:hypothetical protein PP175_17610 [Aneurinibacillus sp. Ricciae_BoGa-3]|uniref:hypothetical protein n=1 Tax=Aneurinibacillus sp. Ricciae_BoGa-3 TaxID=3022697 RepID=UPI00233FCA87|nr:hypothetical protein [Aneurinibacillus sp. Ricciae_BoGa-3]WCK53209.1 hypothetical protein PP175_17610 [Aneurinibacillus sp. Ricciae_BoGa-3]